MPNPSSVEQKRFGIIVTLKSSQLFSGVAMEDLEQIASFSRLVVLSKDEYLFREGGVAQGFYIVQSGAINVHRVNAAGREQVINVFRAGESMAEASLASETGYPANARTVEPSTVLLVPKAPILEFISRRPDLAMRMLGSMSAHLRVLVGMLDDLTLKDVESRLLNWLIKSVCESSDGVIHLTATKRVLAAELGTSSETLSRTLARLRDAGLIQVEARTITVPDCAALQARLQKHLGG